MSQRLVLFGATGGTGAHLLRQALEAGLLVRAVVRSPDKLPSDLRNHPSLDVVRGEFSDSAIVAGAMRGADFVVCTGGNAAASKERKLMLGRA